MSSGAGEHLLGAVEAPVASCQFKCVLGYRRLSVWGDDDDDDGPETGGVVQLDESCVLSEVAVDPAPLTRAGK